MDAGDLDKLELALPVGRGNGTSQKALAEALGWHTRKVQQGFLELRRDRHVRLVAISRPNGCYVATEDDLEELKHTRNGLHSRAMSLHVTVRELDFVIDEIEFSPTLFPEEEAC